jgi:hypothetical protein
MLGGSLYYLVDGLAWVLSGIGEMTPGDYYVTFSGNRICGVSPLDQLWCRITFKLSVVRISA